MASRLQFECDRVAVRARSIRMQGFSYRVDGDRVILEGEVLTPEGIDSLVKLFRTTSAAEVVNRLRHAPPDPGRPAAVRSPKGYVEIVEMGPNAARLAETMTWEVEEGDTLESIAEAVYGGPGRAGQIAQANRSQLLEGDRVRAGQRLRLPPP